MRCEEARQAVARRLAGELDPTGSRALGEHLRACGACGAEAARLQAALDSLGRREVPDPGPEYWASYTDRLRGRLARADARRRSVGAAAALAAAAALVVSVALLTARMPRPLAPRPNPIAEADASAGGDDPEARFEAILQRAAGVETGRRALLRVLDEMTLGDPLEIEDSLERLTPEETEALGRELSRLQG